MGVVGKKVTFGVIIGVRAFFKPSLADRCRRHTLSLLERHGFAAVITEASDTPSASIETMADAKICAELFKRHREEIDGVIVMLPSSGSGTVIAETLKRAGLNVPVLVQAANDYPAQVGLDERRDAFRGKFSVCGNLRQYGIPFTPTTLHTCDVSSDEFDGDVERFAEVCRVVRGLREARIGLLGTRPAASQDARFSEKLLQRTGISVIPTDLSKVIVEAYRVNPAEEAYKTKLDELNAYGRIEEAQEEIISRSVKLSVAIDRIIEEGELDAVAMQCWDSIEENYGCAACVTMSMLGERLIPAACESDVAGAVSMYALLLASGKAPGFLNWNNNYGLEENICVNANCSSFPKSFMGNALEIGSLDVLSQTIDRTKCFGAVKGKAASGDATYFQISTDETMGLIKGYVGECQFVDLPFDMAGGVAVVEVPEMRKLMRTICHNGFEQHVAMVRSNCAHAVNEAVTRYLGWKLYWHGRPESEDLYEF